MAADQDVAELLEDEGVGTIGLTLFVGEIPADVAAAVGVTMYPGGPPEHVLNGIAGPTLDMPRLQIVSRHTAEATAISKAQDSMVALSKIANQTIEGTRYRNITVLQSVGLLFRDQAGNRPHYGFNVECEREI